MANSGGLYTWSRTPANNATADTQAGFAEGQAPSSLNDGCRGLMASAAKYRDDISGQILTTGSVNVYQVNSFQDFDSLSDFDGKVIGFTPHITSTGAVTVTVDGFPNLPLRSAPNIELPPGTLVQGTPYLATYRNADGALYLMGFFGNPYNIPIAAGFDYWAPSAPNSSFAFPFGQAISRTTYAILFGLVGTTYGAGDGSTTFNLPDKRGRISIALDNMGGTAANRVTTAGSGVNGDATGSVGGAQNVNIAQSGLPNVAPTFAGSSPGGTYVVNLSSAGAQDGSGSGFAYVNGVGSTPNLPTPSGTISSINGNVTQTPTIIMPPGIVVPYIMRII